MAKFRTNHAKQGGGSGNMFKIGVFSIILAVLYFVFNQFSDNPEEIGEVIIDVLEEKSNKDKTSEETTFYPSSTTGQVIHHRFYSLSYSEKHEQAEWVAYILTRTALNQPWVDRTNDFRLDPMVKTGSADPYDYRGSGYDRGHLVPAADMAFSQESMSETFYMSNMSPQERGFNAGIWRELEELTRDWAKRYKGLYVVSGPLLNKRAKAIIGKENKIEVPSAFYKVLLDLSHPEQKGIAFIIPNEVSDEPLANYIVTIDEVEKQTGIDFFANLLDDKLEEELESHSEKHLWKFNEQKYQRRVYEWNLRSSGQ